MHCTGVAASWRPKSPFMLCLLGFSIDIPSALPCHGNGLTMEQRCALHCFSCPHERRLAVPADGRSISHQNQARITPRDMLYVGDHKLTQSVRIPTRPYNPDHEKSQEVFIRDRQVATLLPHRQKYEIQSSRADPVFTAPNLSAHSSSARNAFRIPLRCRFLILSHDRKEK